MAILLLQQKLRCVVRIEGSGRKFQTERGSKPQPNNCYDRTPDVSAATNPSTRRPKNDKLTLLKKHHYYSV
jgi:hypothetical protein